jgi:transcriptional regulatory protein LevR
MSLLLICAALRLIVDHVIVYIADMAARFSSTDANEFTLQQQHIKTKAVTKYTVNVLSDFMLEKKYDREIGTMDIVALNSILQDLRECQNQQVEIIILKAH